MNSQDIYDIAIIGVGGMGSATMYELARRGVKVCGIEQFGIAHDLGSSHGETRMIRKAYFEHPNYIPLLNRTYDLWHNLERESDQELFVKCGLVVSGTPDSEVIGGLEACYKEHKLPHDRFSASEAKIRFPQFAFDEDSVVYFDPIAGFLYVEKCIAAHCRLAVENGARLHTNETVESWTADSKQVNIKTTMREIIAEKLIITSGAWAKPLLASIGIELEIWRKVLVWYTTDGIEKYKLGHFPIFYIEAGDEGFYGFPALNDEGIKIGEHSGAERYENPELVKRELLPNDETTVLRFLKKYLPDFQPKFKKHTVCIYTMAPDQHFIIDRHPNHENVFFAAGFSGHGFKFAPVIGEILSDLSLKGSTFHPIDFLRLNRFDHSQC